MVQSTAFEALQAIYRAADLRFKIFGVQGVSKLPVLARRPVL
jgi:hypothetical protein